MSSQAIGRILCALEARGCEARPNGRGWMSRCPAHDDRQASLSIGEGDDGRALVKCFAGCSAESVAAALGLTMRDLMPEDNAPRGSALSRGNGKPKSNGNGANTPRQNGQVFATAKEAVAALEGRHGKRSALWTYHDADGKPAGLIVRWDTPDGKTVRPVSRTADGWTIGAMPEPRPLYRLPELRAAPLDTPIVVCEGEKAADAALRCGLTATTSSGGAQAATKTDWSPVRGRSVVVLPDNDAAGARYAGDVARLCYAAEAASVKILRLSERCPSLPEGGDLADVLDSPEWCGAPLGDAATPEDCGRWLLDWAAGIEAEPAESESEPGPIMVDLDGVQPCETQWLWPERIPIGRLSLIVGQPGVGKSYLTCAMAARVSTGTQWPDGRPCPQGSVILVSAEDDPADTIRPRLDKHHAAVEKVKLLRGVRKIGPDGKVHEAAFTLADVANLEAALRKVPDCKLIVIDPIGSYLGARTDAHRDNEVRGILTPLARLAETHGVAMVLVAHRRKAAATFADDAALGSRAFVGIARAVWHLMRDPENRVRRLFVRGKCNLSEESGGLAFTIERGSIVWEETPVELTADDVMTIDTQARPQRPRGPAPAATTRAKEWLALALADGPRSANEIIDAWENGEGGSRSVLKLARGELGIVAYRPANPGPWFWRLPEPEQKTEFEQRTEFQETMSSATSALRFDSELLAETLVTATEQKTQLEQETQKTEFQETMSSATSAPGGEQRTQFPEKTMSSVSSVSSAPGGVPATDCPEDVNRMFAEAAETDRATFFSGD